MDDLRRRDMHFKRVIKALEQVNNHDTAPLGYHQATTLLEATEINVTKCEEYHNKILNACKDDTAIAVQVTAYDPMEAVFFELRWKLRKLIATFPVPQPSSSSCSSSTVNVKLPAIELPNFDGNYANWPSFKDLFVATIDQNKQLAPSQKLQYLKSSLSDEAAALIRSITITDAHYTEAWDILKERFDNTREITHSLVTKILHFKPLQTESPQELQRLLDNSNECLRALKVLKQPTDQWDTILVVVHVNKLDPNTRREWAIRQTGADLPTFKDFTKFVSNHIRGLLATGASNSTQAKPSYNRGGKPLKSHHSTEDYSCSICSGKHPHYKCQHFHSKSPKERSDIAKDLKLCFNCLQSDHMKPDCRARGTCRKCGKKHHTLLHLDQKPQRQPNYSSAAPAQTTPQGDTSSSGGGAATTLSSHHVDVGTQVLLSTALVHVEDANGTIQVCRLFLDSGSQATFISEKCVNRLGLQRQWSRFPVKGISSTTIGSTKGRVNVKLFSRHSTASLPIDAHILPKVTSLLPGSMCKAQIWEHLQGITLADPTYHQPGEVDILLGADYVAQLMREGRRTGVVNSPIAQETLFGWVLSGRVQVEEPPLQTYHITTDLDSVIQRFWVLEEPPKVRALTTEEKACESHFLNTIARDPSGRFIVSIPFNEKKSQLGTSREAAVRRLLQVERRLKKNPKLEQQYAGFMEEYEALNHMEKIPESESREVIGRTYYLPHHFVVNESSSTTKLRVVFDGSAKTSSGVSLNDTLMVGPTIQDDLYDLLLRFRLYPIVLKADITKMFRQFSIKKEDADFHRIVWRKSPDHPISDYRLLTLTYGTGCASFTSTRCLAFLAEDCKKRYPSASKALSRDAYVDDLMTGEKTPAAAITLYKELTIAAAEAQLDFRKWASNDQRVLAEIPVAHRETDVLSLDSDTTIKALGVLWNPTSDTFGFKYVHVNQTNNLTKRALLSDLAKVFDPLGLVSAVTIRGKLLLQELWKLQVGWDDLVPTEIQREWDEYQLDLQNIGILSIPRRITHSSAAQYQLHGFCDASERAYGAVVYLRAILHDGSTSVSFITSKTRVAPLKEITLPRKELVGALLLAELISYVRDNIDLDCPVTCWCDSTIALRWIAAHPRRWKTFVANRVAQIQEMIPTESWKHVPGIENPADMASRGVSAEALPNTWWTGPTWLSLPQLPVFPMNTATSNADLEERTLPVLVHHSTIVDLSIMERFSSLSRLQRVTAFILRFLHNARRHLPTGKRSGPISPIELKEALVLWIKRIQQASFKKEISRLQTEKQVANNSKLRQLNPYLSSEGVLRVSGRLRNAHIPETRKHLIILPSNSHFTRLLIEHTHHTYLHSGFQQTWATLQREYWIVQGRARVRHVLRSCVVCRRYRGEVATQIMGDLPVQRVTPSRPFLHTAVDYAGPFMLKNVTGRSPKTYKGYLSVFVCMASKAIHLEAVSSLSTEAFIATLRRFVSRRGLCAHLYSDRGSNFVSSERELQALLSARSHQDAIGDHLSTKGISFHFTSPYSPHHNALAEAGVKSAKHHIRRTIGNSLMTYEQFSTVLCQVEAILNSRPLHPLSADPTDFDALTPGHFLIGEPLLAVPDADLTDLKTNRLSQYQLQQQRVQHFWKRWSQEYLNTLQQRRKWWWEQTNMKPDDLVLIKEETSPGTWKMGRIVQTHPGLDGRVRVVTLKTANSTLQRPIVKLIPLFPHDD